MKNTTHSRYLSWTLRTFAALCFLGFAVVAVRVSERYWAIRRIVAHGGQAAFNYSSKRRLLTVSQGNISQFSCKTHVIYACAFPIREISINLADGHVLGELACFPEVEYLELDNGSFNDASMSILKALPNLRWFQLNVAEEVTDQGLFELEACPKLESIKVSLIGKCNGEFLTKLRCHETLTTLELGTEADDDSLLWLEPFRELTHFSIEYGSFEGYGFDVFPKLRKLQYVRINAPLDEARSRLQHVPKVEFIERFRPSDGSR